MTVSFEHRGASAAASLVSVCASAVDRRLTRRKPSYATGACASVNLSSFDSDFLSGLFADVTKLPFDAEPQPVLTAAPESPEQPPASRSKRSPDMITSSPPRHASEVPLKPNKRSRLSMIRCLNISRPSVSNLGAIAPGAASPKGVADADIFSAPADHVSSDLAAGSGLLRRQDSLAFQLNCISGSSGSLTARSPATDPATAAFPHLPVTVSNSSCNSGHSRSKTDIHASSPDGDDNKESFGWFVDLDDDDETSQLPPNSAFALPNESADLAFHAYTAPKRVNDDAELEWAKAADTVDDVLGDFF